jgi:hypothetical protein
LHQNTKNESSSTPIRAGVTLPEPGRNLDMKLRAGARSFATDAAHLPVLKAMGAPNAPPTKQTQL